VSLTGYPRAGRFRVWKNFNTRVAVLHLVPGFDVKVCLPGLQHAAFALTSSPTTHYRTHHRTRTRTTRTTYLAFNCQAVENLLLPPLEGLIVKSYGSGT
jgi:hypothetical protein